MRSMIKSLLWPSRFLSKVLHASLKFLTLNKLFTRLVSLPVWGPSFEGWCTTPSLSALLPIVNGRKKKKRLRLPLVAMPKIAKKWVECESKYTLNPPNSRFLGPRKWPRIWKSRIWSPFYVVKVEFGAKLFPKVPF